ncbi:MAG: hypothetical protein F4027_10870 [Rhodospirillaceae bacterium]|nr:hypothetical protein [Rhodospirillaceae bacterium]
MNINVVGRAYNLSVEYNKLVKDLASGEIQSATTWDRSVTGTHGGNDSGILSLVSQYMDRFIDEYLRVNTDACRSSN